MAKTKELFTFTEFQMDCERTRRKELPFISQLLQGCLGITGEAGEVADVVKKCAFQGHKLNRLELLEEIGDTLYYVSDLCTTLGFTLQEVAQMNIGKRLKRFPNGFTIKESIERKDA